jgi:hypothetical protein
VAGTGIALNPTDGVGEVTVTATDGFPQFSAARSPEGTYVANPGATFQDTSTGAVYLKVTGTGATGWAVVSGAAVDFSFAEPTSGLYGIPSGGYVEAVALHGLIAAQMSAGYASTAASFQLGPTGQSQLDTKGGMTFLDTSVNGITISISNAAATLELFGGNGTIYIDCGGSGTVTIGGGTVNLDGTILNENFAQRTSTPESSRATALLAWLATFVWGTPIQNTLGTDLLVTISVPISGASAGVILADVVAATSGGLPASPISPPLTTSEYFSFTVKLAAGYYLYTGSSGTITTGTAVAWAQGN